jgi:hypothetical protein
MALLAQLRSIEAVVAEIFASPALPVEPGAIALAPEPASCVGCRIDAPSALVAEQIAVSLARHWVAPGEELEVTLSVFLASAKSSAVSLHSLASHVRTTAVLSTNTSTPLSYAAVPDVDGSRVLLTASVPLDAPLGSTVLIDCVSVAGCDVPLLAREDVTATVMACAGLQAPAVITSGDTFNNFHAATVTREGALIVPCYNSTGVTVYASDGSPQSVIPVNRYTSGAAYSPASGTLLVGSGGVTGLRLKDQAKLWRAPDLHVSYGIAAFEHDGTELGVISCDGSLVVFRVSDGARVGQSFTGLEDRVFFLSVDALSGTIFASVRSVVSTFSWDGNKLVRGRDAEEAVPRTTYARPLTVVPPAPGKRRSYLVVAEYTQEGLQVLLLPELKPVHTHPPSALPVGVGSLTADATGTSLIVFDHRKPRIHVLRWPLEGMPPLL